MDRQEMEDVTEGYTIWSFSSSRFSPVIDPWSPPEGSKTVPDFLLMIAYVPGPYKTIAMLGVGVGEVGTRGEPCIVPETASAVPLSGE